MLCTCYYIIKRPPHITVSSFLMIKKKEKKKLFTVHQAFTLESNAQVKPPLLFYLQMQNLSTINNTIKCTQKRLTVHHELKQFG